MARIDISARIIGDSELAQTLSRLSSHDIPKAIKAGVRLAASGARTQLAKGIREHYGLSSARIKDDISQARFSENGQTAVIKTSRKPISSAQFKPRQTLKGVSLAIFRGKRTTVKSGIMQFSKAGKFPGTMALKPNPGRRYKGDMQRRDDRGWKLKPRAKPRAGLDMIHGPSIHAIYTGGEHAQALQARVQEVVAERLEKGIMDRLKAMGRGYGR